MTFLGKLFVFIILIISLGCAAVAVGLYTNRIDYPGGGKSITGEAAQGLYAQKRAELDRWNRPAVSTNNRLEGGLVAVARLRWMAARDALPPIEKKRQDNRVWYVNQLNTLGTGLDPEGRKVASIPVFALTADGKTQVNADGHPDLAAGPGLMSHQAYLDALDQTGKDVATELNDIQKLIGQEKDLTTRINGGEDKGRGLRVLIQEEKKTAGNTSEEMEKIVKPLRVNREVEGMLLEKRRKSLETRKDELKQVGVAASR